MNYLLRIIFLLLMVVLFGCEKDDQVPTNNIIFDDSEFGIDVINKIIVYNGNSIAIENGELNIGDNILEIDTDDDILSIGKAYTVTYSEEIFQLFYTQLPIISVKTNGNEIIDDPKVAGSLRILEKNKEAYNSFIGIELRGGVSQEYPKKSYSMELWADEAGDSKEDESLLGMRVDDDWILDGMWNEPNRIRDYTSHDLWLQMGRVQNPREETKLGIDRKYCELFENGNYKGVYCLSEKIDRKQLDLKKYDKQLEGELYKGYTWGDGVTFAGVTDFDNIDLTWSGYEAKYPDDVGFLDWSNLFNHVDFITSSSQSDFNSEISFRIDMKNAIDYFIFINFIYASDNTGKNIYIPPSLKNHLPISLSHGIWMDPLVLFGQEKE